MIKNIIIINDFDYIQGGASKVAIQTANLLAKYNGELKVYFFSAVHNEISKLDEKVVKICTNQNEAIKEKNRLKGCINGIYNFKAKKELRRILRTLNKDETIIHVHGWTKALSSSIFDIAFKMNFKVVLTMHDYFTACPNGGYFNYKKNEICRLNPMSWKCIKCNCDSRNYMFKLYRIVRQFIQNKIVKLNSKLTDVITISDFSEVILRKTISSNTKIHRVYNPIDLDSKPKKIDYKKNKYYLYVGRISKEKGVDIFCDAIEKSNQTGIVVGDGEQKELLEKKYPTIKFVGWKSPNEVKEYMKKAKALIIPSRCYECAPLTPLEIMQYSIPIITSDCNAAVDYIKKGNGLKFKNTNDLINILKNDINIKVNFKYKSNYVEAIYNCYLEIINEVRNDENQKE